MNKTILIGGGVAVAAVAYLALKPAGGNAAPDVVQTGTSAFFVPSSIGGYADSEGAQNGADNQSFVQQAQALGLSAGGDYTGVMLSAIDSNKTIQLASIASFGSVAHSALQESLLASTIGKLQKNQGAQIVYDDQGQITSIANVQQVTPKASAGANKAMLKDYQAATKIYLSQLAANAKAAKQGLPAPFPNATMPSLGQFINAYSSGTGVTYTNNVQ